MKHTSSYNSGDRGSADRALRLPGVDLLRVAAILAVMLYHLSSHGIAMPAFVEHGWMGVDLFFVLSGYLIGWQVLRDYANGGEPRWRDFMLGRALRILPAYFAMLALYALLPVGREGGELQPLWKFLTFSLNLFPDWEQGHAYSHAWSLCVEEHFYMLLPLVVWLLGGRSRAALVGAVAVGVIGGGMLLRAWLWHAQIVTHIEAGDAGVAMRNYVGMIYMPTYARLDGLLAGVMLAAVRAFRPRWWAGLLSHAWLLLASGTVILACCTSIAPMSLAGVVVLFPLVALGCACLLAGAISPATWIGRSRVSASRITAILAFSLYLCHKQVFGWLDIWLPGRGELAPAIAAAIYMLASFAFAALLYLAVERPGLRLRERYLGRRLPRSDGPSQANAIS